MGPIEALEMALRKEIDTKNLYTKFSGLYPQLKDIFIFLQGEEEKHEQLIEKKIAELQR